MSKRIIRTLSTIAAALTLCFVGCSEMAADTGTRYGFTSYDGGVWKDGAWHIIDNVSGVVYVIYVDKFGAAITPAYNADGTLLTKKQLEVGDTQ